MELWALLILVFAGWAAAIATERRARSAERRLGEANQRNDRLERAVRELLRTRRAETRARFLELLQENEDTS